MFQLVQCGASTRRDAGTPLVPGGRTRDPSQSLGFQPWFPGNLQTKATSVSSFIPKISNEAEIASLVAKAVQGAKAAKGLHLSPL